MYYVKLFGLSFLLTLIFEMPLAALLGVRTKKGQLIVFSANLMTNPIAVCLNLLVYSYLPSGVYYPLQLLIELFVIIAEGIVYRIFKHDGIPVKRPFLLSVILNVFSYGMGFLFQAVFH